MGELIRYVVAHEVGHTLGFQHNMKASAMYSLAQVRDKQWVKQNSHTPTLMDYSRFNYVAQPEDGIDPADLIPKIGPYDKWATMWGYKPIPGGAHARRGASDARRVGAPAGPDAVVPLHDRAGRRQRSVQPDRGRRRRRRRAGDSARPEEPAARRRHAARGDDDAAGRAVSGADRGLRAAGRPVDARDEPRDAARRRLPVAAAAHRAGRASGSRRCRGRRQAEAVQFLLTNAFPTPGVPDQAGAAPAHRAGGRYSTASATRRTAVMNSLLQTARLERLIEQAALDGTAAYAPLQFLTDLRRGIWSELATPARPIDPFRRNTQRVYLDTIDNRLNGGASRPPAYGRCCAASFGRCAPSSRRPSRWPPTAPRASTSRTRATRSTRCSIRAPCDSGPRAGGRGGAAALDAAGSTLGGRFDYDNDPFLRLPETCWPDYQVQ